MIYIILNQISLWGQKPISCWKDIFDDPTIAEAVLDRILNNSYNIKLQGESLRKR